MTTWIVQAFDANVFGDSAVLGCDFAGTVEKVDDTVKKVSKGDQVAGLIWGGELPFICPCICHVQLTDRR